MCVRLNYEWGQSLQFIRGYLSLDSSMLGWSSLSSVGWLHSDLIAMNLRPSTENSRLPQKSKIMQQNLFGWIFMCYIIIRMTPWTQAPPPYPKMVFAAWVQDDIAVYMADGEYVYGYHINESPMEGFTKPKLNIHVGRVGKAIYPARAPEILK